MTIAPNFCAELTIPKNFMATQYKTVTLIFSNHSNFSSKLGFGGLIFNQSRRKRRRKVRRCIEWNLIPILRKWTCKSFFPPENNEITQKTTNISSRNGTPDISINNQEEKDFGVNIVENTSNAEFDDYIDLSYLQNEIPDISNNEVDVDDKTSSNIELEVIDDLLTEVFNDDFNDEYDEVFDEIR